MTFAVERSRRSGGSRSTRRARYPAGVTYRFEFWRRLLLVLLVLFAVQATTWPLMRSFDPFGLYEFYMSRAMWGTERLPEDARRAFAFALIPLGATTAGFFVLAALVVQHAFPRRELWAFRAVVGAVVTWFVLDTGLCAVEEAWFNILIVNLPCAIALSVPLGFLARHFCVSPPAAETT